MTSNFISLRLKTGVIQPLVDGDSSTSLYGWKDDGIALPSGSNYFGFVYQGSPSIRFGGYMATLSKGMFFSVPGEFFIGGGSGIIVSKAQYSTLFYIGGPIEKSGRLRYIDGCTDSLLIPPTLKGDPCLNALYFPPGINQTQHTHPSVRVGIVAFGKGKCIVPDDEINLEPGNAFIIPANGLHSFKTESDPLVVIAYHPDSDFGPTHEDHPMVNRTIVDGISASYLENIRTKELPTA